MRIITGIARGTKLVTMEGTETRPTSERIKEAIFSAIQFELHDRKVLDLFGGCGQMALEALSRGADSAVIVDNARGASEIIKTNAQKTHLMQKCRVLTTDWKDFVKNTKEKFSLVFIDPPYKEGIIDEVLGQIIKSGILSDDAIVVCESEREGVPAPTDACLQKVYRYGRTYITIIRKGESEQE